MTAVVDLVRFSLSERNLLNRGRILAASLLLSAAGMIAACAPTSLAVQSGPSLDSDAQWVLLPIANNSESPQAAEKLEAILPTLLRIHGVSKLGVYSPQADSAAAMPVLDDTVRFEKALAWARGRDFRYGITGSIEEWHYKSGVAREPAVGISLRVLNISTGEVLWSASGARTGGGRETVSSTAMDLAEKMLDTARIRSSGTR
jgi:polysaccharide biosynthesis protein PelC